MSGVRSEQELVAGLAELAESAAPPSGVDVCAAVRQGRGRVARRRMSVWGAAAAVLLVCSSVAAGVGGRSVSPVGPAGPGAGSTAPSVTPRPGTPSPGASAPDGATAADGFAPLSVEADFGWLPDSMKVVRYTSGANGLRVQAADDASGRGMRFGLAVYRADELPPVDMRDGTERGLVAAAPVNGREAFWAAPDSTVGGRSVLRWHLANGRWAELTSSAVPPGQQATLMHKVAEKASLGLRPVALPVRLTGVPAAYAVTNADLLRPRAGAGDWSLRLTFSVSSTQSFSTTVVPLGSDWLPRMQAVEGTAGETDPSACREQGGLMVCVQTADRSALTAVGGPAGWLPHVVAIGADPAAWESGTV